jgi:ParB family chromosome partitioning protein
MKTALGKGLDSLIPGKGEEVIQIDVDRIRPGKLQPRKQFNEKGLRELSASIREKGVIQPIIVSRTGDGTFSLITGERRWRATMLANIKKIPALIKNVASKDSLEIALIENIQREDLNPIEAAEAFRRLIREFKLSQEELATKVGKERATIANYLRLLKLPDEIKKMLYSGTISMGHARALLSIEARTEQIGAARKIIKKGLSVREAESLVNRKKRPPRVSPRKDPEVLSLEQKLIKHLGTKVRLLHKGNKGGKLEIEYYSLDELDRLLEILLR